MPVGFQPTRKSVRAWDSIRPDAHGASMIPLLFCIQLLLSVPRQDSVGIEALLLPQPTAGGQQQLVATGRYSTCDGWRVSEIRFCVRNTANPKTWFHVPADYNGRGQWRAKMPVSAGDYECWVEMTTTDAPGDPRKARTGALTLTKRETIRVK